MRFFWVFISLITFAKEGQASLFRPVSFKEQIKSSEGVVIGVVTSMDSQELTDGRIVTKVGLLLDNWVGPEVDKKGLFEIYYPGGLIGDHVLKVEGAPKFELGEHVALFVHGQDEKYWVQNLGMGKYSIKRIGHSSVLVNQIFPENPNMGQIELERFKSFVERLKGNRFVSRFKDKYDRELEKMTTRNHYQSKVDRAIASQGEVNDQADNSSNDTTWWFLLLLGVMGSMFTYHVNKKRE